jgi:hypothetical protein
LESAVALDGIGQRTAGTWSEWGPPEGGMEDDAGGIDGMSDPGEEVLVRAADDVTYNQIECRDGFESAVAEVPAKTLQVPSNLICHKFPRMQFQESSQPLILENGIHFGQLLKQMVRDLAHRLDPR